MDNPSAERVLIRIITAINRGRVIRSLPSEGEGGLRDGDGYFTIKWLGSTKKSPIDIVWIFEYVLKYVVPEEKAPPTYYRWIHQVLLERRAEKYIFKVMTGEGVTIDARVLGGIEDIDPGEILTNLLRAYLTSYRERIRAFNAYYVESFDTEATLEKIYSEIQRVSVFPTRVVLLETLRDHGDARELNQSVLHVDWIYVMVYR